MSKVNEIKCGHHLEVETEEEILNILERTILFTKKYSNSKYERLGTVINRIVKDIFFPKNNTLTFRWGTEKINNKYYF